MPANKTKCTRFEQMSKIMFSWLRSVNQIKFTERCVMYSEIHVLVQKMFTNGLKIG